MRFKLSAFADEADRALSGQISAMLENGIGMLEIRRVDGQNVIDISQDKAREIRQRLDDNGLAVWSIGSSYGKIKIEDEFAPHLDKFKRSLEVANVLGTQHMRMFSFYVPTGWEAEHADAVMERLGAFCAAAEGSGVVLCHENEKGIYGETAARCAEIHQAFPQIRAVFDPANFVQCKQDTIKAWELLSPYVEYLHIKDALETGVVVPAGKGVGNLPYILERYQGQVLSIEPHLSLFDGFAELEAKQKTTMGYCYPSARAAFNAAADALKELLEHKGEGL